MSLNYLIDVYKEHNGDLLSILTDQDCMRFQIKTARFMYWRNYPETPMEKILPGLHKYEFNKLVKLYKNYPDVFPKLVYTDESLAKISENIESISRKLRIDEMRDKGSYCRSGDYKFKPQYDFM